MKTEQKIVLTIFGGERCVTTLDDLEAAATAIHQKAVREKETSAQPSTLSAEIEGQNSPIKAQSDEASRGSTKENGDDMEKEAKGHA